MIDIHAHPDHLTAMPYFKKRYGARTVTVVLDLGNQIGGGDVDEVTGGEGKQKSYVEGERRAVRNDTA